MPSRLADRIEMALAAERAATTSQHQHARDVGGSTGETTVRTPGRPDLPERSRRKPWRPRVPDLTSPRLMRGLAATAAVLLLGGVGYALANRNVPPAQVTGPRAAVPARPRPGRSEAPFSSATGLAGNAKQFSYPLSSGKSVTYTAETSHDDYTPANLAKKIHLELTALDMKASSTTMPGTTPSQVPVSQARGAKIGGIAVSQLGECLSKIASGHSVVVVVVARYENEPAVIVVLSPRSASSASYNVIVAGIACAASNSDIITQETIPTS